MGHEPYHLVPVTVVLQTLQVADDIVQVVVPVDVAVFKLAGSLRTLAGGTTTVTVKNSAGSLVGQLDWSAAGPIVVNPAITAVGANDRLRIGIAALGVGVGDLSATIWLKMPSLA